MFKKMLDEWARFLSSSNSTSVLDDKKYGWFSPYALEAMRLASCGSEKWKFEDEYIGDPKAPHYGFTSWDDFFVRRFKDGARPVAHKDDNSVIVNACECSVCNFSSRQTNGLVLDQGAAVQSQAYAQPRPACHELRWWYRVPGISFSDFVP
ncbi:hypothetical protein N431DRAFT_510021 [Stipitochalara longipes BDJ]|nr:hypothetical protein N431DRAFT_510021 [Stipitochalara longipes BDJ]